MWRWLLLGLSVHWNTIISQPITNDHERTQPTECCPCPKDHVTTVSDQRFLSDEENATLSENFANIETSFDRENNSNSNDQLLLRDPSGTYADAPNGIMDNCPCRVRDADTVGSPSKFIPSAVNDIWTDVSSKEKKEDIKPLLHPEVDLASSVLETLREATDEEYSDALVRDAAKNAMREDDSIESNVKSALDTAKNIVNLIINPKQEADVQDDVIQEESHTHESRCIHPLSKFNIMTKEPITKPSNLLSELYYLPKMKPLFHKKNLDMDNSVGASNVNEHIVSSSNVKNNLNLKSNPSLFNLYSDDGHKEDTDLFKESNKLQPNILTLFKNEIANVKPYPTLKQIITPNDINKDVDNSLLAIQKPNRNNIDSKFKLKSLLPISGLTVTTMKPFNLKNLLKLKDVELISPSKIVKTETENVKGNIPQLLPVLEETNLFKDFESSNLGDFISNELNLNINALKKNNHLNNYKDETNDLNQSNNVQIIPNSNRKIEIMDVVSSPSEEKITWNNNNVKEEENCKVQKIDDTNTKRIPKVISSQNSISKINIEPERNKFNEPVQFTKITQILDALPSASEDKIRIVTNSNPDMNDSETQVTDSEEIIVNNGLNNEDGDNDNVNNEGNDDNSNHDTTTETEFSDLTEEDSLDQTINEDLQPQITENMNFVDNIINDGTNSESDLSINVESRELYDEENKSADCEDFGDKDEIDGLKSRNSIQTKEDYLDQTENKEDLQSQTSQNAEVVDSNINSRENSESDLSLNFESEESYDEENRNVDSKDFSDEDEIDGLKSRNNTQIKEDCLDQSENKEDLQPQTSQNVEIIDSNRNSQENRASDFSLNFEPEESYDEENRSVDSKDFSDEDEMDGLKSRNSIQINEDCLDQTVNKEDLQSQTNQNSKVVDNNINNRENSDSDFSLYFEPEESYDEENRSVDSKDFSEEDEIDGLKSRNSIQINEDCLDHTENKEDLQPQTSQNVEIVDSNINSQENRASDFSLNFEPEELYDEENRSVDSKDFSEEDEIDGLKSRNSIQINEDCLDHTENKEDLQPQTSQNVEIVGSNINNQENRASDLSLNFEPEGLYDEENRSVDSKDFSDEDEMDELKSRNSIQIKENCLEQSENKEDLHPQTSQNVEVVNNINNNGENFDLSLNIKSRESYDTDNGSVDSTNFSYEDEKDIPRTDLFNKMISELLSLKESISKTLNDMKKSMKHSNISVEQDKVESANDNKENSEVYKVNRDNDIEKSKNDSNSFIRTLDNNDENANNINSQELQNMSDNLLHLSTRNDQEPLGTQTIECTEAITDSSIESNEFGASINTLTKSTEVFDESAENKSIESTTESQITPVTEIIDSNTDFISNTMKAHEADSENSCLDRNIGINTDKNNEMTAEGSHPVGNTITTDNTLFPNIFRSNLLDPKLNIGDILNLNLPQSSVIPNIFDKPNNNMDAAEHDNNDCSLMATQANTPFSKTIISPLKPLEDIDLDIFQLNPLIGSQNIFSKLPRLNINSYKTKLAMPKTLGIMPLKLESSVGNNNGIFGASLTMGPKVPLGKIGKEPSILGTPLNNLPTFEDLQESIRENAHNLLYTPLEITSKNVFDDTLRSGQTISDNIRSHTKNAMRDIQQTLETTLKDVKNSDLAVLGDSLSNPHEFLQAVSRTHEDVNDKLKAIHYDLNDRLESIRDRIIDPSLLPSLTLPLPLSQHSGKYSESAIFPSYSERKPVRYLEAKSESWKDKTSLKKSDSKAKLSTPKISSPKRKPPSTKTISDIPLFKGSEVSKLKGAASEPSLVQYPAFKIPHFSLDKKSFPNLLAEPISRFRDSKIPVLSTYKPKSKVKISFSQTTKRPQTLPSLKNKNSYGLPKSKLNTTPVLKKVKLPTLYRESVKNNHRMQSVKSKQRSNFDSNGAASDLTTSVLQPSLNKPNKVKSAIELNESDYNTRKDLKNSPESLDLVDIPKSRFMNSIFKNRSNQFKKSKLNEDFMRNLNSKLRSTTVLNKLPDTRNTNFFSMGENMPDNSLPSDVLNDIDRSDSIQFNTDMTRSASKSNDMIQYKNKPLEENTSYTCRMMCTKKV
ncbi:protein PFC0760c-like [Galleria mellonella]|uniref:Protein PFC0760c-like n=1 Tax=Galleria mellonella TaxID=7137 RepID=A0ABM3MKU0_GALME|nr:protein PFC0760c-like [Galleria mellonella]